MIRKILATKEYTYKDFLALHRFYAETWGRSAEMKKYFHPDTLYNEKYSSRFEASISYRDSFIKHINEIKALYGFFSEMFIIEAMPKDQRIRTDKIEHNVAASNSKEVVLRNNEEVIEATIIDEDADMFKEVIRKTPFKLKQSIVHWLEYGYSLEEISTTINESVIAWKKRAETVNGITLSKILDDRFPERVAAVKNIVRNREGLKSSVDTVNAWK